MNRTLSQQLLPAIAAVALTLPSLARAELYCVSNASQMTNALAAANASASASEIRVRTGSYTFAAAPPQGSYIPHSLQVNGPSDLLMTGGWTDATCQTRGTLNPEQTILSTGGNGKLMHITFADFVPNTVEISGFSFRNSVSADLEPACLLVDSDIFSAADRASLIVDRNSFRLCFNSGGTSSVAALGIDLSSSNVYVRNNLFADNGGVSDIVRIFGRTNTTQYITQNTIAYNGILSGGTSIRGLNVAGANSSSFFWVVNNVSWNNGSIGVDSLDFISGGFTVGVVSSNLIGRMGSLSVDITYQSNLNTDPRFVSSNDLRPTANSPLRNSGGSPVGGALDFDLFGTPRTQGGRIDRGAHEFEEFFANGFE